MSVCILHVSCIIYSAALLSALSSPLCLLLSPSSPIVYCLCCLLSALSSPLCLLLSPSRLQLCTVCAAYFLHYRLRFVCSCRRLLQLCTVCAAYFLHYRLRFVCSCRRLLHCVLSVLLTFCIIVSALFALVAVFSNCVLSLLCPPLLLRYRHWA